LAATPGGAEEKGQFLISGFRKKRRKSLLPVREEKKSKTGKRNVLPNRKGKKK